MYPLNVKINKILVIIEYNIKYNIYNLTGGHKVGLFTRATGFSGALWRERCVNLFSILLLSNLSNFAILSSSVVHFLYFLVYVKNHLR